MVLWNWFPLNSPTPIAEYIASDHTADPIRLMIRTLKELQKEIFAKGVTPALVMSDFTMAIINTCMREFNKELLEDYFERRFRGHLHEPGFGYQPGRTPLQIISY